MGAEESTPGGRLRLPEGTEVVGNKVRICHGVPGNITQFIHELEYFDTEWDWEPLKTWRNLKFDFKETIEVEMKNNWSYEKNVKEELNVGLKLDSVVKAVKANFDINYNKKSSETFTAAGSQTVKVTQQILIPKGGSLQLQQKKITFRYKHRGTMYNPIYKNPYCSKTPERIFTGELWCEDYNFEDDPSLFK
jgi:hypothetical protein